MALFDKKDTNPQRQGRSRILYIEDSALAIRVVEEILSRRPTVDLVPATTAAGGLEVARRTEPKMIILDLGLPDRPGIEVMEVLQDDKRTKQIPVVVLTADSDPAQEARLLDSGALAYLTKPMDENLFLALVDECLSRSAQATTAASGNQRLP
jgi:DNA-binding response OmpR family regulator